MGTKSAPRALSAWEESAVVPVMVAVAGERAARRFLEFFMATMGREIAAIAVAIVSTKDPEHFTRTAGHYFYGTVERAKRGELHLDRTVWGLRAGKRGNATERRA